MNYCDGNGPQPWPICAQDCIRKKYLGGMKANCPHILTSMNCPKCGSEMNPSWIDDKDWDYSKNDYREPDWWICECGHEVKVSTSTVMSSGDKS